MLLSRNSLQFYGLASPLIKRLEALTIFGCNCCRVKRWQRYARLITSTSAGPQAEFRLTGLRSVNVLVDFQPHAGAQERMLKVRFGVGQVTFGGLSQVTFLSPGVYRLSGLEKGNMAAKRGLRWQMTCFAGPVAGTSNQLYGAPRDWREFSFDFTIPDDGRCDAQRLRLFHDARSASERFASGEILFRSLRIKPAEVEDSSSLRKP